MLLARTTRSSTRVPHDESAVTLDLSTVAKMNELAELAVVGDATSIETIVGCANLQRLRLT
jgi:hypothetical protein